ncbi:ankyrin repeat domain-containing protein [Legionella maioricensis]|uniref:Ankyrin repeat domain-containing protein n=1 Tax=Legionella maioricensis TaxID=2896528 RepID=A0A9X2IBZ4_9GAMM|nr:ankyrin repeat domain-containing protein [Legionella maioricensis]MCL9685369.1 ankyrin repeat domain-containing protein [Legionella maioricensis]MCL9688672.1 ankyrin repeat domain-containing protein [Legionella maioricensis]
MTVSKIEHNIIFPRKIQRGLGFLNQFPQKRFFQLFVHGDVHLRENGQNGFESREPYCVRRFYDGFIHAIHNINGPLSVNLLLEIHAAATKGLQGEFRTTRIGKFRNCPMQAITFDKDMCTIEGIKEQIRIGESYEGGNILGGSIEVYRPDVSRKINLLSFRYFSIVSKAQAIYENSNQSPLYFTPPSNTALLAEEAQKIIDDYLTQIQEAQNTDAELLAIVCCAKRMLLLHPFEDGNLRVFVNIMLNFLLIQRGYPPCIFYNPNVFYLFATKELVEVVKIGIMDSIFVINNPTMPLFGYDVCDEKYMTETRELKRAIRRENKTYSTFQEELDTKTQELEQDFYTSINPAVKIFHQVATQGRIEILDEMQTIEILQARGPENTTTLFKGKTLIQLAFLTNHCDLLYSLLNDNPQLINEKDLSNKTIVHYAIEHNQLDLVAYLCRNPYLDLECEPISYLNFAVMNNDLEVVKILLEHGAVVTEDWYKFIPGESVNKEKLHDLFTAYSAGLSHRS